MAFSFNWAGLVAPQVSPIRNEVDADAAAAALGKGLRGYRNRRAAEEYADIIDGYRSGLLERDSANAENARDMELEIKRLREENARIDEMLTPAGGPEVTAVERDTVTPEDEEYARQLGLFEGFDPANPTAYSRDDIKTVQSFIGVPDKDIDGRWGPQSQGYWDKFTRNYNII